MSVENTKKHIISFFLIFPFWMECPASRREAERAPPQVLEGVSCLPAGGGASSASIFPFWLYYFAIFDFKFEFYVNFPLFYRKFPGNFREISGKFPINFREISGKFPGNFREFSGKFPGKLTLVSWKNLRPCSHALQSGSVPRPTITRCW